MCMFSPSRFWVYGSDLRHSAINEELNAGDVACFVLGEKCHSFGDLARISKPAERNRFCKILFQLCQPITLLPPFENRGVDVTRADCVHANAPPAELIGPGSCEGPDGRFGRAVNADAWESLSRGYRGSQYDASSIIHQ